MMKRLKALMGPMRVPFLVLTPACVLLGAGTAYWRTGQLNWTYFLLALFGAVAAHVSVNALNEYFDFKSGLDLRTQRTPFSGGSGTLPAHPELAQDALRLGIAAAALTAIIGLYFITVRGWALLPLGVLGLLTVVAYTPLVTRSPFLCLIAPGLGFGPLMVMGTDFVLTGHYSASAFVASLVPFFLVNDLLLLNQFPDVEADRTVGRRHYPMVIGRRKSSLIYAAFLALAYLSLVVGVLLGYLPRPALLGLLTLILAVPTARGAYADADNIQALLPHMGKNVIINITTPVLIAAGLFLAG